MRVKRRLWLVLCVLFVVAVVVWLEGTHDAGDPIIGKWIEATNGYIGFRFAADGTAAYSFDYSKMRERMRATYPGRDNEIETAINERRVSTSNEADSNWTWRSYGGEYRITASKVGSSHAELKNGLLQFTNGDGTITTFARVPDQNTTK